MRRWSAPTAGASAAPSSSAGASAGAGAAAAGSAPARAYLAAGVRERDGGSLMRAPAALLGEGLVGRLRGRRAARRVGSPAWLAPYARPDGAAAPIAPTA